MFTRSIPEREYNAEVFKWPGLSLECSDPSRGKDLGIDSYNCRRHSFVTFIPRSEKPGALPGIIHEAVQHLLPVSFGCGGNDQQIARCVCGGALQMIT